MLSKQHTSRTQGNWLNCLTYVVPLSSSSTGEFVRFPGPGSWRLMLSGTSSTITTDLGWPFYIDSEAVLSAPPAYSGEMHPRQGSAGDDDWAAGESVSLAAETKASAASSVLLLCKNQDTGLILLEPLLHLSRHSLPCYQVQKSNKLIKQISM